ncbi:MAG TPA: winged helix-turn-helix domain-containing protein [Stenotrophomonas sp.]|jgi:DNA-binding winged helix-turn-helix (wHTH) protein/tetratricopeptide (TPR) repeat protein
MTAHYLLLDLHIDLPRQRVTREGAVLDVTGLSFQLLAYLLAQGQRVVGFDELMRAVWAPAVVNEETVTQRVRLLRQALGDDARRPRYLRSVRAQGYQLVEAPVSLEAPAPMTVAAKTATRPSRPQWRWLGVGLAAMAITVGLMLWRFHSPREALPPVASPLQARAAYYADIGQADNNERAITLYRQVLAETPDSRAALAGLSRALSARTCLYNGDGAQAQEAAALAERLLQRDDRDAVAWTVLGYAHDCLGDMRQAVSGYEKAVALDPGDDKSRASLAYLHQEQGRLADALHGNFLVREPAKVRFRNVQIARELELLGFVTAAGQRHRENFELFPDNVFANIAWPQFLLAHGRSDEAAVALRQANARGTPHPALARLQGELALLAGDRPAAVAAFAEGARLRPHQSLPTTLASLYAAQPPSQQWWEARLAQLRSDQRGWPDAQLEMALIQQQLDQPGPALAALRGAVATGFRDRAWLAATPLFAPLRRDAGFGDLLAQIDADIARQRAQVERAPWLPPDLR